MKVCPRCHNSEPTAVFSHANRFTDGKSFYCTACMTQMQRTRRRRQGIKPRTELMRNGLRWCWCCRRYLALSAFGANKRVRDGRNRLCRTCAVTKRRRYVATHAKIIRAQNQRRWRTNVQHRLHSLMNRRIRTALLRQCGTRKQLNTETLVGCTVPELRAHIEAMFEPGMTWANLGRYGWHVHHIRPCCTFDLMDEAQQRQCFNFTNLKPVWAKDHWHIPHKPQQT